MCNAVAQISYCNKEGCCFDESFVLETEQRHAIIWMKSHDANWPYVEEKCKD